MLTEPKNVVMEKKTFNILQHFRMIINNYNSLIIKYLYYIK